GQYLRYFAGRRATYIGGGPGGLQAPVASMVPGAFERLQRALGLAETVTEGDTVALAPDGLPSMPDQGRADYQRANFLGLRTPDALYRFFGRNAFGGPVGMSIHLFDDADPDATCTAWQAWLDHGVAWA